MKKTIRVVYDLYKLLPNGETNMVTVWDEVSFGKNNMEYDDHFDYQNNVEMFITQVIDEGVVYIGDGKFIPSHNIHGFYFNSDFIKESGSSKIDSDKPQNLPKPDQYGKPTGNVRHYEKGDGVKSFGKHKKIRHKNRHNPQPNQQSHVGRGTSNLPFNVEKEKPVEVVPVQEAKRE